MPPRNIGQGSLEIEPLQQSPEAIDIDLSKRFATSALIKRIAQQRQEELDPSQIIPDFMDYVSPSTIEAGIYLPKGKTDRDIDTARGPVIFPASEYKVLTKSPKHVANTASAGVKNARHEDEDKEDVDRVSKRAAGHALEAQLARTTELLNDLQDKEKALKLIENEVFSAKGTGYFAHYPAEEMLPLIGRAEAAIFDALNVAATTGGWTEYQYQEAKKALSYQLFGIHKDRYSYWRQYTPMVHNYTRKRRMVVESTVVPIKRELAKYQPYLEDAEESTEQTE